MAIENPCTNCGKPVPDGARLCPNCGAGVVPLPVLDGSGRVAGAGATEFYVGSRGNDMSLGIVSGVALPLILGTASVYIANTVGSGQTLGGFADLALMVFVLMTTVGIPIFVAKRIKRNYFVFGDTMQKTLWGWLILFIVSVLGLFAACATGLIKI